MRKPLLLLLFIFISCVNDDSKTSEEKLLDCSCPLGEISTLKITKDTTRNILDSNSDIDGGVSLNRLVRKIIDMEGELSFNYNSQNENSNIQNSITLNESELDKEIANSYATERSLFCAKYEITCRANISDSLKTEIYFDELNELKSQLRKMQASIRMKDSIKSIEVKRGNPVKGKNNKPVKLPNEEKAININEPASGFIITNNQSGGTNTIINPKVSPPPPKVNLISWDIQNKKVDEAIHMINQVTSDTIFTSKKFDRDTSIYLNEIKLLYESQIKFNLGILAIKLQGVITTRVVKNGMLYMRQGKYNSGEHWIDFMQPENGIYTIKIYSKNPVPNNIKEVLRFSNK